MTRTDRRAAREADLRAALAAVTDPELDESVTELGFVTDVAVDDDGGVSLGFRLPTYWCAANFAFLMADDMRRAAAALPWVRHVAIRLDEHMYGDDINRAMAHGLSFQETFGDAASGDLVSLRRIFLLKAFQRRQEALLTHLRGQDVPDSRLTAMTLADLHTLPMDDEGARLRARYLERRDVPAPAEPQALAFIDADGGALDPATLTDYVRTLRRVGINAEFNGALCRGLLAARYGETQCAGEPTLLDFVRQAAQERGDPRDAARRPA